MEVQSVTKYLRMSPEKAREVGRLLQGKPVPEALDLVSLIPRKAARCFEKTLKSAVANAENNLGLDVDRLMVSTIAIDQGPTLKRFMARARGRGSRILKRTSHITVAVAERD